MSNKNRQNSLKSPGKNPPNLKKAFLLFGACVLTSVIYFGVIAVSEAISQARGIPFYFPISIVYIVLTGIGVCAMIVVNAGMGSAPPEPSQLPQKWDDEKKERFINSFQKRKKVVKTLAFWVIAFIVPVAIDLMQIWLEGLFKK